MMKIQNMLKTEAIGPSEAKFYLEVCEYRGQRNVRDWWAKFLANQMEMKRFASHTDIHLALWDNSVYLIDGQHRLIAIRDYYHGPIEFAVIYHHVKNETELAQLYSQLDQGMKRSASDTFGAWGLVEKTGLNKTQLNQLVAAARFIADDFGIDNKRHDIEDQVALLEEWVPEFVEYIDCTQDGILKNLAKKAPVLAVGLVTLRYEPILARDFWHQVSWDDGLKREDVRKTLNTFLLTARTHGQSGTAGNIYSRTQISLICARCWNAYLDDQSLQKLYIPSMGGNGYLIENTPVAIGASRAR